MRRLSLTKIAGGLVLLGIAVCACLPAAGQIGGGGFGGGGGGLGGGGGFGGAGGQGGEFNGMVLGGNPAWVGLPIIFGDKVAVIVSEDKERVAAYNARTGEWHVQSLQEVDENTRVTPIVSAQMVSVAVGDRIYAYSGVAGRWDTLKAEGDANNQATHHKDYLVALRGDIISMFSAETGRWSSLNWKRGKTINWKDEAKPGKESDES